jgi:hypothetical protein
MKRIQIILAKVRNLRQAAGKVILGLAALLLLSSVVLAANGEIPRYVIGGGGGHAEASPYALDGTVGQPVVGVVSNAPYQLCSGFWCEGVGVVEHDVYLPLILRNYP